MQKDILIALAGAAAGIAISMTKQADGTDGDLQKLSRIAAMPLIGYAGIRIGFNKIPPRDVGGFAAIAFGSVLYVTSMFNEKLNGSGISQDRTMDYFSAAGVAIIAGGVTCVSSDFSLKSAGIIGLVSGAIALGYYEIRRAGIKTTETV